MVLELAWLVRAVSSLTPAAQAAPIVDMSQPFNGTDDTTYAGTVTTQNGHSGAWANGYNSDKWSGNVLVAGREAVVSNSDDLGGTWGKGADAINDHLTYSGREWRDLSVSLRTYIAAGSAQDTQGVLLRWTDDKNFYAVFSTLDGAPATGTGGHRVAPGSYVYEVRNGVATQLASSPTAYAPGAWNGLRVDIQGGAIAMFLDLNGNGLFTDLGENVITVTDPTPLPTVGRFGLYCYNAGAEQCAFDDLTITIDNLDSDGDSIPDARDNCPTYANATQLDVNGNRIGDVCDDDDSDGYAESQGDCNDANAAVRPGATEACDAIDSDCDKDLVDGFPNADADSQPDCIDADDDGDGVADASDCKSLDKTVYPGATEVCDAIDQDCDGNLVETFPNADADTQPDCIDADDDNDGSPDTSDCKPLDKSAFPGAPETCDTVDSDCDGDLVDGSPNTDGDTQPDCIDADDDNDGTADAGDCKPADASVYPGATEVCDAVDQDCDGNLVESFPNADTDAQPDCIDADDDNDTYLDGGDCGPLDPSIHPNATESPCDTVDSDCDGSITDGVAGDFDKDGNADCTDPDDDNDGEPDLSDCDDFNATTYPGAPEVCDAVDSDCDGDIVESFADFDTDTQPDCIDPDDDNDGSPDASDCAATNASIHPGQTEICDAIDSNCDKSLVDGFPNFDADLQPDCIDPDDDNDTHPDLTDCDDANNKVFPGGAETCDAIDSDCDGDLVDTFTDTDKDKSPDCVDGDDDDDTEPDGLDCGPTDPSVNHAATETCNGKDDDCSGTVDDSYAQGAVTFYLDSDGDGHGDVQSFVDACSVPSGYAASSDDCDDNLDYVNPLADEVCDGVDDDCDGAADDDDPDGTPLDAPTWFVDGDGDAHGDPADFVQACDQPVGYVPDSAADDCDDANTNAFPGNPEVCNNGFDDNCDGTVDTDAVDQSWWPDADGDGYGDDAVAPVIDCEPPAGAQVTNHDDCDDTDDNVQPGASERPNNGIDDDCNPDTPDEQDTADSGDSGPVDTSDTDDTGDTSTQDADGDGVSAEADCDDADATVFPGAEELADTVDQDCDGLADPAGAVTLRGCGCNTPGSVGFSGLGVGLMLSLLRRRRAH